MGLKAKRAERLLGQLRAVVGQLEALHLEVGGLWQSLEEPRNLHAVAELLDGALGRLENADIELGALVRTLRYEAPSRAPARPPARAGGTAAPRAGRRPTSPPGRPRAPGGRL